MENRADSLFYISSLLTKIRLEEKEQVDYTLQEVY